jgi:molecular chaperone GrpE (heat shock protein)
MDRDVQKMMDALAVREEQSRSQDHMARVIRGVARCATGLRRSIETVEGSPELALDALQVARRMLVDLLRSEGVELFGEVGEQIDPARHDIAAVEESASRSGIVLEVLQEGVRWEDAVLRKASVVASKAGSHQ